MRFTPAVLVAALLMACAPAEEAPEVVEAPPPPAGPTLADFAGTWQNSAMLEGQTAPVPSTWTGTAGGTDWTMSLEGRPNVPVQASVVGDSLIVVSSEYESVLRPGVMVRVRSASVLQNGALVGNMVATYRTPQGDQAVRGTITGTRIQ
ncbi:MAG: hypothetical protein ABR551_08075 [Gemmatimonadales bacterium]